MKSHYEVLGVYKAISDEGLKSAWRELSRKLHPDRNKEDPLCEMKLAEVSAAYHVLSDKQLRLKYDKQQAITTTACQECNGMGATWKQKGFTILTIGTLCKACNGNGRVK